MTEAELEAEIAALRMENRRLLGATQAAIIEREFERPAKPRPITGEWRSIIQDRERQLELSRLRNANRRLTCS